MVAWRVYYGDGSTFDSSMGEPDDAPAWGGVRVLQHGVDGGGAAVDGCDFYVYESGRWIGADLAGIFDKLANRIPFSGFIAGRWVHDLTYREVFKRSSQDDDFFAGRPS